MSAAKDADFGVIQPETSSDPVPAPELSLRPFQARQSRTLLMWQAVPCVKAKRGSDALILFVPSILTLDIPEEKKPSL